MAQAKIRKAKPADVAALTKMFLEFNDFEEAFDPEFKALNGKAVGGFRAHVNRGIRGKKGEFILVAEAHGKIAGLVYCEERERPSVFRVKRTGYVNDLFVLHTSRKQGLGTLLMKAAEKEFKKRKLKYVCLTSLSNNKNALKAYKALGFKEYKKEMRKKLPP